MEKLEILALSDLNAGNDIHDALLKHCKNLKHLKVTTFRAGNIDWLLQHYPTLQSLNIQLFNNGDCVRQAGIFIRNNPTIKHIWCCGIDMTKAILLNSVDIKRLVIEIFDTDELGSLLDDLKTHCARSPIECLEFELSHLNLPELEMLKGFNQIVPIHGLICKNRLNNSTYKLAILFIMDFTNLKKLDLDISWVAESIVMDSTKKLSKEMRLLEELELHFPYWLNEYSVKKCLMSFVRNSVSMKRIKIHVFWPIEFNRHDFLIMNAARLRLPGQCPMKIHTVRKLSNKQWVEQVINIPSDVHATKCMILDQIPIF